MKPLTTMAVTVAPVMPARSHSVLLATQNNRTRSGTLGAFETKNPGKRFLHRAEDQLLDHLVGGGQEPFPNR